MPSWILAGPLYRQIEKLESCVYDTTKCSGYFNDGGFESYKEYPSMKGRFSTCQLSW